MALSHVDYITIGTIGFTNIYSILTTNSSSTKVTNTFSINSEVPIITLTLEKTPSAIYTNDYVTGLARVTIRCVAGTEVEASNISVDIQNILKNNYADLKNANMQYREHRELKGDFERGTSRVHYRELVYLFLVR